MQKEFISLTPQELNRFLISKTGISLIVFSLIAYNIIKWKKIFPGVRCPLSIDIKKITKRIIFPCAKIHITNYKERGDLIELRRKIENLQKKIIDTLVEIETCLHNEDCVCAGSAFEKKIVEYYEATDFFNGLDEEKRIIEGILFYHQQKRGAPINRRNLLFAMFASHLRSKNIKIDWSLMADLIDWYWEKYSAYEMYGDFKPTMDCTNPDYLKNQYFKNKKRWDEFYRDLNCDIWEGVSRKTLFPGQIIVFGKKVDELNMTCSYGMELFIRKLAKQYPGKLWEQAIEIYKSRANFKRRFFKEGKGSEKALDCGRRANLNWLVVFPDGTYAIDPE